MKSLCCTPSQAKKKLMVFTHTHHTHNGKCRGTTGLQQGSTSLLEGCLPGCRGVAGRGKGVEAPAPHHDPPATRGTRQSPLANWGRGDAAGE